ncbi:MAG: coniferyl aldehyde dehydrogenase [Pseudoalteromonas sp.]|uniref:coniferyl aldehyde dehydrogenase n=1 Tax=unclassified Pseudoalteromonas TaxID=194690 RepID=UPI003F998DA3
MSLPLSSTFLPDITVTQLGSEFEALQQRFMAEPYLPISERIALLTLLKRKLLVLETELVAASSKDFGYRTEFDTVMGDLLPTIKAISHTLKHLDKWAKDSPRRAGFSLAPSKVSVSYQPKGVVGIIAPWNYPIQLALVPLITALAAGNRIMLKLSEFTHYTNQVLKRIFTDELDEHCSIIEGGAHTAEQFSQLPFGHLFFTGSTVVGRHVMAAASSNLTPVTLELGGKSPVIVTKDADINQAAKAILFGKMANAGQICVAPDYVLVDEAMYQPLLDALISLYKKYYGQGVEGKNLSSILNDKHFKRLQNLLDDAKEQGAEIINPLLTNQQDTDKHRLGLHLVTQCSEQMKIMHEEIFGPLLVIKQYQALTQAIDYIKAKPHPLALYVMSHDEKTNQLIKQQTQSGTLTVNDVLMQVTAEDVPFGGIGESGMGNYHGKEGFITFSHARNMLTSGRFNPRLTLLLKKSKLLMRVLKWLYLK